MVVLELRVFRSGLFREPAYWISMAICYAFMIPVDGWLTKHSAPIVIYRPEDTSGIYPIWDIPLEEYVYAFALLTLVMLDVGPPRCTCARPPRRGRMSGMTRSLLVVGSFVVMEGVSYAAHRWVMHGFAMAWHRSHHPRRGPLRAQRPVPGVLLGLGVLLFALGALGLDAVLVGRRRRHGLRRLLPRSCTRCTSTTGCRSGCRELALPRVAARLAPRPPPDRRRALRHAPPPGACASPPAAPADPLERSVRA